MSEYLDLMLETSVYMSVFLATFDLLVRQVENELIIEVIAFEMEENEN